MRGAKVVGFSNADASRGVTPAMPGKTPSPSLPSASAEGNNNMNSNAAPISAMQQSGISRQVEDYNNILDTIGAPNYTTIRNLFTGDGCTPADTVPSIQVSFELFETVQARFATTKQTLERTKADLLTRNQQYTALNTELQTLRGDYTMLKKRAKEAEENNTALHQQVAKQEVTAEQLRREVGQVRAEMDLIRDSLLLREEELQEAQNRIAEAAVLISQKDAVITTLRRELGTLGRFQRKGQDGGADGPYSAEALEKIAEDVESRTQEARMKLNMADLELKLKQLEREKSCILDQHTQYLRHVERAVQAYETQCMSLEDGVCTHACVTTPYFLSSRFYEELTNPEAHEDRIAEENSRRTLEITDTEETKELPVPTFYALALASHHSLDRLERINIDPASAMKDELNSCISAQRSALQVSAELIGFLSTFEKEVTETRVSLPELREEWNKARVPFFASKAASEIKSSVTALTTALVRLLERENEYASLNAAAAAAAASGSPVESDASGSPRGGVRSFHAMMDNSTMTTAIKQFSKAHQFPDDGSSISFEWTQDAPFLASSGTPRQATPSSSSTPDGQDRLSRRNRRRSSSRKKSGERQEGFAIPPPPDSRHDRTMSRDVSRAQIPLPEDDCMESWRTTVGQFAKRLKAAEEELHDLRAFKARAEQNPSRRSQSTPSIAPTSRGSVTWRAEPTGIMATAEHTPNVMVPDGAYPSFGSSSSTSIMATAAAAAAGAAGAAGTGTGTGGGVASSIARSASHAPTSVAASTAASIAAASAASPNSSEVGGGGGGGGHSSRKMYQSKQHSLAGDVESRTENEDAVVIEGDTPLGGALATVLSTMVDADGTVHESIYSDPIEFVETGSVKDWKNTVEQYATRLTVAEDELEGLRTFKARTECDDEEWIDQMRGEDHDDSDDKRWEAAAKEYEQQLHTAHDELAELRAFKERAEVLLRQQKQSPLAVHVPPADAVQNAASSGYGKMTTPSLDRSTSSEPFTGGDTTMGPSVQLPRLSQPQQKQTDNTMNTTNTSTIKRKKKAGTVPDVSARLTRPTRQQRNMNPSVPVRNTRANILAASARNKNSNRPLPLDSNNNNNNQGLHAADAYGRYGPVPPTELRGSHYYDRQQHNSSKNDNGSSGTGHSMSGTPMSRNDYVRRLSTNALGARLEGNNRALSIGGNTLQHQLVNGRMQSPYSYNNRDSQGSRMHSIYLDASGLPISEGDMSPNARAAWEAMRRRSSRLAPLLSRASYYMGRGSGGGGQHSPEDYQRLEHQILEELFRQQEYRKRSGSITPNFAVKSFGLQTMDRNKNARQLMARNTPRLHYSNNASARHQQYTPLFGLGLVGHQANAPYQYDINGAFSQQPQTRYEMGSPMQRRPWSSNHRGGVRNNTYASRGKHMPASYRQYMQQQQQFSRPMQSYNTLQPRGMGISGLQAQSLMSRRASPLGARRDPYYRSYKQQVRPYLAYGGGRGNNNNNGGGTLQPFTRGLNLH